MTSYFTFGFVLARQHTHTHTPQVAPAKHAVCQAQANTPARRGQSCANTHTLFIYFLSTFLVETEAQNNIHSTTVVLEVKPHPMAETPLPQAFDTTASSDEATTADSGGDKAEEARLDRLREHVAGRTLVVLCAGAPTAEPAGNVRLQKFDTAGRYLGSKTRFDAARALLPHVQKCLAVGGAESKVVGMEQYILSAYPETPFERLVSEPDTNGNMRRLLEYMQELHHQENASSGQQQGGEAFVVLTNAYHIPRAAFFAADILPRSVDVIFLAAETVLYGAWNSPLLKHPVAEAVGKRVEGEVPLSLQALLRSQELAVEAVAKNPATAVIGVELLRPLLLRLRAERNGLQDWANGTYRGQFRTP